MESVSLSKKSFEKKKKKKERGEKVREDERSIGFDRIDGYIGSTREEESGKSDRANKGTLFQFRHSTYPRIRDISFQEASV